jgi:hypothetical protein
MKETAAMLIASGTRKARLPWPDLFLKSFLAGAFISLGALFDLVIASGAPSLRSENPSLVYTYGQFYVPNRFRHPHHGQHRTIHRKFVRAGIYHMPAEDQIF